MSGFIWLRLGPVTSPCQHGNKNCLTKTREFDQLLQKDLLYLLYDHISRSCKKFVLSFLCKI